MDYFPNTKMSSNKISAVAMKAKEKASTRLDTRPELDESENERMYEDYNPATFNVHLSSCNPCSTWRPSSNDHITDDVTTIWLKGSDYITVAGEFGLVVLKGAVEIGGYIAAERDEPYTIFAPNTHGLPSIRCVWSSAHIQIGHRDESMNRLLKQFSFYPDIWNQKVGDNPSNRTTSFSIIPHDYVNDYDDKGLYRLNHLQSWWDFSRSLISEYQQQRAPPKVLICGQNLNGKSTCARFLTNRLLSQQMDVNSTPGILLDPPVYTVFWLDLDPNKPEFSPPGQISLIQVHKPLFGPPFTHNCCHDPESYQIVRAHCVTDPIRDGGDELFWNAVANLENCYVNRPRFRDSPLIINCPGYKPSDSNGSKFIKQILKRVKSSRIAFVGQLKLIGPLQPSELHLHSLKGNAMKVDLDPSPPLVKNVGLSRHDLMSLQAMSYFHAYGIYGDESWNLSPIQFLPKWHLSYDYLPRGEFSGVVTVKDHPIDYRFIQNQIFLRKNLVGICVLEDDLEVQIAGEQRFHPGADQVPYLTKMHRFNPYRPAVDASRLIGWGYVLEINKENKYIELVTPLAIQQKADFLKKYQGAYSRIVLIRTPTNSPDWALAEEYGSSQPLKNETQNEWKPVARDRIASAVSADLLHYWGFGPSWKRKGRPKGRYNSKAPKRQKTDQVMKDDDGVTEDDTVMKDGA